MADFFSHYGKYDGGTDGSPNTYSVLKINSIVAPLSAAIVDLKQFKIDTNSGKYLDRRYFTKSELGTARLARVHWENIIRKPDLTPAGLSLNHNHDQRYYTRSEVDNKLNFQINQTIQSTLTSNYVSVDVLEQTIIGAKTFNDLRFGDDGFPSFLNDIGCNIVVPATFSEDISAGTLITVPILKLNTLLPKNGTTFSVGLSGLSVFDKVKVVSEVPFYANNIHTGIINITGSVSSNLTVIGDISATGNISSQGNLLAANITGSSLNINGSIIATGPINASSGVVGNLTGTASYATSAGSSTMVKGFDIDDPTGKNGQILVSNGSKWESQILSNNITNWALTTSIDITASSLSNSGYPTPRAPSIYSGADYKYAYRLVGNSMEIKFSFGQTNGGDSGSGYYLIKIPNGGNSPGNFNIDPFFCKLAGDSPGFGSNHMPWVDGYPGASYVADKGANIVGNGTIRYGNSSENSVNVIAYNRSYLLLSAFNSGTYIWRSDWYQLGLGNLAVSFNASFPIITV